MPDSPIPRNVPLRVDPEAYDFEACIDGPPLTQTRVYRITMTGPGRIKLRYFGLRGSGAGFFTLAAPHEVELHEGDSVAITVTFDPEKTRTYRAKLRFLIHFNRPNGSILSIWGKTRLTGVGKACAAAGEEDGEGDGEEDDGGDEGGAGDGGDDGGETGGGDGGDADDGEGTGPGDPEDGDEPEDDDSVETDGEEGGGASPGSTPEEPLKPEKVICLRFWKLPGAADDLDEAAVDRWLEHTNRIWSSAGIRFTRTSRPFEKVEHREERWDAHCLDVYVGGPGLVPGPTLGDTETRPNPSLDRQMEEAGAHADFREHSGVSNQGDSVQMESGHGHTDRQQGQLLAHELGHALGLGPAPDGNAEHQEHLDPATGEPITNPGRLMHPQAAGGEGLTDMERRIARLAHDYVKGSQPRYSGCEKTSDRIPEPEEARGETRSARWGAELRSLPDSLQASIRVSEPFGLFEGDGARFALDLDLDDDGEIDWSVECTFAPGGGRIETPGPAAPDAMALGRAWPSREIDRPREPGTVPEAPAVGLLWEIPKSYLGPVRGPVGWRLRASLGSAGTRTVPSEGLGRLDLTRPLFVLDLDEGGRRRRVRPGEKVELAGSLWTTSTFTGGARIAARLSGRAAALASTTLEAPLPERWSLVAAVPKDLEPGRYRVWIEARCGECGVETSLPADWVVE